MRKIIFILLILSSSLSIFAQWNAKAEMGSSLYSGNVNKFDLRSTGKISHADSSFEFSTFYKAIYAENNHIQNNQEYSGGFKFDYLPKNKFSPFVAINAYRNEFKNIHQRLSSLLGSKYVYLSTASSKYSLSVAGQYDMEKYVEETPDKNKIRLSVRPKFVQKIGTNAEIKNITYFQPNLQRWSDLMIESETSLKAKITKVISLKISYIYEFVNEPTKVELLQVDQALYTSLVFELK